MMLEKIIIMLTHNDKTVPDAIEIFEENKDLPIQYWGFKDVGMEPAKMKVLCDKMHEAGKTAFLEVVSIPEEECMRRCQTCSRLWLRLSSWNSLL